MYATIQDIKASSRNLEAILCADTAEITDWMEEACDVINKYCSQDFSFEQQVTKVFRAEHFIINLPKILSGDIAVSSQTCEEITVPKITTDSSGNSCLEFGDYQLYPGKDYFIYHKANKYWPPDSVPATFKPDMVEITGDWGYAATQDDLVIALANALRSSYEAHIADVTFHQAADVVNVLTAPVATDLASAILLLNDLKAQLNLHVVDLIPHLVADTVSVDSLDATDLTSAVLLAAELKSDFNEHLLNEDAHLEVDSDNTVVLSVDTPILPRPIRRVFIKLVKRLAIRNALDDQLQYNSYYQSETTGDGYTYNLSNGTMRNLLRPEDREALWPYVNHGTIIR